MLFNKEKNCSVSRTCTRNGSVKFEVFLNSNMRNRNKFSFCSIGSVIQLYKKCKNSHKLGLYNEILLWRSYIVVGPPTLCRKIFLCIGGLARMEHSKKTSVPSLTLSGLMWKPILSDVRGTSVGRRERFFTGTCTVGED